MRRADAVASMFAALLGVACSCDHGPPVPFGLEGQRGDLVPEEAAPPPRTHAIERRDWEAGTPVTVGGIGLSLAASAIRSTVALDLDHDDDVDALLVALETSGPAVYAALRNGATYQAPAPVPLPSLEGTCVWTRASFVAAGSEAVVLELGGRCRSAETTRWIALRVDARPRALESFTLARTAGDAATTALADRDADGHDDLVLSLDVPDEVGGRAHTELVYFDRPAGLARDTSQPEASLAATLGFERPVARRHPDRLLAAARRTIALHSALCGAPSRLVVGAAHGLACGASPALGHAFVVVAAASARAGETTQAIDAFVALEGADVSVRDVDRTLAREALVRMAGALTPPTHEGPEASVLSSTFEQRLSSLAFVDEDHVWLRARGESVTLEPLEVVPEPRASVAELLDPSGRFALTELRGSACGADLAIEPRGALGLEASPSRTIPAQASGTPCSGSSSETRLTVAGVRVLGWAPQGILLARGAALSLVPLDLEARPAGEPAALPANAAAPAPIAAGYASSTADAWTIATPVGLLVFRRAEADARLVRPVGYVHAEGTEQDVAMSPAAERVAWIEGGHLRWAVLSELAPPPSTP